jgi:hypothetical protein
MKNNSIDSDFLHNVAVRFLAKMDAYKESKKYTGLLKNTAITYPESFCIRYKENKQ